ncbi:hypothetical protein EBO15_35750 [Actinomadura harenae]|uniref:Uncharacterized protein n=1 Tax=Actinomadura harenae TaxID=2483351 RepID=A0A3M2LJ61_9ACTN|nr:hypothetical protein EBO15_35750 [Actinomadura harenae]
MLRKPGEWRAFVRVTVREIRDPVNLDERAVQHQVQQPVTGGLAQRVTEVGRTGRQQLHGLLDRAPRGRGVDTPNPAPRPTNVSLLRR